MRVQALGPEPAVKRFDERVVRRLAWPGEVERDASLVGPEIEIPGDELRAQIDADGLRITCLSAHPLECVDHVFTAIAEARVNRRCVSREGVDHGQDPNPASCRQLVVNEVHGPGLVGSHWRRAVLAQLGLDPPLRRLVAQLQAQFPVQAIEALRIDRPTLPTQQDMDAPIPVAYPGLGDLLDLQLENGLIVAAGPVMVGRSPGPQHTTRAADADLPVGSNLINKRPAASRPQSFFDSTSCNIALSRLRSATSRLSLPFSSSSCFNRFISEGISPAYFLRQFAPVIERRLRDTRLAAHLANRCSVFCLL